MDTLKTYDVVLLGSLDRAVAYRKAAANRGDALLGVTVSTFGAWIGQLWELFGDGRGMVSRIQREAYLRAACEKAAGRDGGEDVRGLDRVAAACVDVAAGLPAFERAVAAAGPAGGEGCAAEGAARQEVLAGLVDAEATVLAAVSSYYGMLRQAGLVEPGQAAALLAPALPDGPVNVLLEDACPLTPVQEAFFAACPQVRLDAREAGGADGPVRVGKGIDLRFAFPSGAYAWPALLADIVRDAMAGEGPAGTAGGSLRTGGAARVVVAAKDPVRLFESMAPELSDEGLAAALRGRRAFGKTDLGRCLCSLRRFLASDGGVSHIEGYGDISGTDVERWNRADLADWALSPFSGLSRNAAFRFDAEARGDRVLTREQACARLRRGSETFEPMERVAASLDLEAVAALSSAVRRMTNRSEAWRAEQMAALQAVSRVAEACRLAGLGPQDGFDLLERVQVDVSRVVAPRGVDVSQLAAPDVLFCDQAQAAAFGRGCCEVLVAADLTSAAYPVSEREDASSVLLGKLGIASSASALGRMRRDFYSLEHAPRKALVLERPLNDENAEPTYPCAVLEEFIDCYRADLADDEDIDNPYALPEPLQAGMLLRGEDALAENHLLGASQQMAARVAVPRTGELSEQGRARVVLPRVLAGGEVLNEPCLSPSQIESYLECPYKWFAQRRLRLEDLDEGFGPLEMGDFAHNALHSFYKHFAEDMGQEKVTAQNLGQARELMADVLRRHEALQPHLRTSDNRLIPTGEMERRELAELERKLVAYLDFEAQLLPTFSPRYLEHDVAGGGAARYAGHMIVGTADRIDVDEQGRCVVIDYKGSVGDAYEFAAREQGSLGKVQALIYAQVVRRTLGLEPVGALYVCYGRRNRVCGAYDGHVLENAHVPNARHAKCMVSDRLFAQVLDETEEAVARAVERMLAGDVAARPATPEACKWCPVSSCSERRG